MTYTTTESESKKQTEYEAAFAAGAASCHVFEKGGSAPLVVVPAGYELQNLETYLPAPKQIRQTVNLNDVRSFIGYVNRFKDNSAVFVDMEKLKAVAVLDYHEPNYPAWGSHKATLTLKHSAEWQAWKNKDRQTFGQVQFAEFLEDNQIDIVEPDGATVLEAAMHLEAKKTVKFTSGTNLANGAAQLVYEEAIEGKGRGNIVIPTRFKLGIAIFEGGLPVQIDARLRYRIIDDKLTFTYILERPADLLRTAFNIVVQQIADETGIIPLAGSLA